MGERHTNGGSRGIGDLVQTIRDVAERLDQALKDEQVSPARVRPADVAHRLYRERRLRDRHFRPGLFRDPAWDLMLALYIAEHDGKPVNVTSACLAADVPMTTALRFLERLEQEGFVRRSRGHSDARLNIVSLTETGSERMTAFLECVGSSL